MMCPKCGEEFEITVRWFNPLELQPTLTTVTDSTVKTKPNPEYQLPDTFSHGC